MTVKTTAGQPDAFTLVIGNYRYSSWSMRAYLAMEHAGLPYKTKLLEMNTPAFFAEIKNYSPTGLVPALLHGDEKIWDSYAILDYVARLTPEHYWWPKESKAYGFARSITAEMHSGFSLVRRALPMNVARRFEGLTLPTDVKAEAERIDGIWQYCRARFGVTNQENPGPFLFGAFSAADIMFAPIVGRFLTYGVALSRPSKAYSAVMNSHAPIDRWYMAAQKEQALIHKYEKPPLSGLLEPEWYAKHAS